MNATIDTFQKAPPDDTVFMINGKIEDFVNRIPNTSDIAAYRRKVPKYSYRVTHLYASHHYSRDNTTAYPSFFAAKQ